MTAWRVSLSALLGVSLPLSGTSGKSRAGRGPEQCSQFKSVDSSGPGQLHSSGRADSATRSWFLEIYTGAWFQVAWCQALQAPTCAGGF